uniref:Reverse transcriptase domain, zinc finger, CCHC-type n=1 Tax=Tanacetum cinerariifolium TaxID=118510 RepID=A0A699HYM5_TANCI|nr:reverse transcriptase domain, zinc finger, CCHC-type [Tanacetum cinerariifolium]
MWDVSLFKKHKVLDGDEGFIAILGEWLNVGTDCLIVVVYAPQDASKKRILWIRLQLITLPRYLSDHCLLLLKSHSCDYGPIPFKFFNSWLLDVELSLIVHRSWSSSHVTSGHHSTVLLKNKLQNLKNQIRSWRKDVVSRNDKVSRDLRAKVDNLNIKVESGLNETEIEERLSYLKKIEDFDHLKNLDHPTLVTLGIYEFSKEKFRATTHNRPHFNSTLLKSLPDFESSFLDNPFTCQEIKNAVWDYGGSKAPGSDGFSFKFIPSHWDIIGEDFSGMVKKFKLDGFIPRSTFEKAFDSLDWGFLDHIMTQMGFSGKWRMWIRGCLKSAYGSVLVNGSPTREFKIEKGLRQGEALSPFLFIIAVEALHVSLQEAKSRNLFEGINVGSLEVDISHLQFALVIGKWSIENASNLCRILRCFNLASGLKVNVFKSKLFGVGVDSTETHNLGSILNVQPSTLPYSYPGLLIGAI